MSWGQEICRTASLRPCAQTRSFTQGFTQDLAFHSTGDVAVLLTGTKKQELVQRCPEVIFSKSLCSRLSLLAGSWGCIVPWKRRAVAAELKTLAVVSGTWRMLDWSGSMKKSDLAV